MPFCRLDMTAGPIDEAARCLDAGAAGIKLHPRAQAFDFGEAGLNPVFQLAAERRAPILIHAGRGLPAIADDLRHLVERNPDAQLILAHAAIADLEHIARTLVDHPNVLYDTSVWSTTDLRTLLASASPEQIVFASDAPYGMPATARLALLLVLRRAGASDDQIRAMFWGNAERAARGEHAPVLSPPLMTRERTIPLQRLRIHDYLVMTQTLMWSRMGDRPGALGLALRACDTDGAHELADVAELIEGVQELWAHGLALEDEAAAWTYTRVGDAPAPDRGRARPGRVIAAVVLAAGEGRRYGGLKQPHPVDGRPMLEQVLRTLAHTGPEHRVVVLGARAGTILERIDLHGAQPVVCDRWDAGQAASLHAGLAALPDEAGWALVVLGDGPHLDPLAVDRIDGGAQRRPPGTILAADYGGGALAPGADPARPLGRHPRPRRTAGAWAPRRSGRLPRPRPAGRRRLRLIRAAPPQPLDESGRHRLVAAALLDDRAQAALEDVAVAAVAAVAQVAVDAGRLGLGQHPVQIRLSMLSAPRQGSALMPRPRCPRDRPAPASTAAARGRAGT